MIVMNKERKSLSCNYKLQVLVTTRYSSMPDLVSEMRAMCKRDSFDEVLS